LKLLLSLNLQPFSCSPFTQTPLGLSLGGYPPSKIAGECARSIFRLIFAPACQSKPSQIIH